MDLAYAEFPHLGDTIKKGATDGVGISPKGGSLLTSKC